MLHGRATDEVVKQIYQELGWDKPILSQYFDFLDFNSNTGTILGASISGGSIPAGESLLVQVSFTDYLGSVIF